MYNDSSEQSSATVGVRYWRGGNLTASASPQELESQDLDWILAAPEMV
jgi:hypothetical protein